MHANRKSLGGKETCGARPTQRGVALVETVLIATFILIPLVIGAIDFGRGYYVAIEVANAARTAVQYGSQNGATLIDTTNMIAVAKTEAPDVQNACGAGINACWRAGFPTAAYGCECSNATTFAGGTNNVTSCSCPGSHSVNYVKVTTQVTYTPLLNLFGPITLNSQAKMRYGLQ